MWWAILVNRHSWCILAKHLYLQLASWCCYSLRCACIICLHYQAFYEMFVYTIEKWNPLAANQNDESFLCDLIHFHATVKEWDSLLLFMKFEIFSETSFLFRWFLHTVDVYSPFLLVQILSSTVLISTALFFLDPMRKIILKSDA